MGGEAGSWQGALQSGCCSFNPIKRVIGGCFLAHKMLCMIKGLGGSVASSKISSIQTEQLPYPTAVPCVWMGLLEPSIPPIPSELTLPALTSLGYPCMQLAPAWPRPHGAQHSPT